jgi:hypothetical protein
MEDKRKKQKLVYMLPFTGRRKSDRVKTVVELSAMVLAIAVIFALSFAGCTGVASPTRDATWIRLAPTTLAEKDGVRTATLLLDFSEPIEGLDDERTLESLNSLFTFGMAGASSAERPLAGIQATKIVRSASGMYFLSVENVPESGIGVVDINKSGISPKSRMWNVGDADVPEVPETPVPEVPVVPDPDPANPSKVTGLNLSAYLAAPVQGTVPSPEVPGAASGGTTALFETPEYTGVITWEKVSGNPSYPGVFALTGEFHTEAVYRAAVTLTARDGYTFTGVEADTFIYKTYDHGTPADGQITNPAGSGDGSTLTVTIVFPETEDFPVGG